MDNQEEAVKCLQESLTNSLPQAIKEELSNTLDDVLQEILPKVHKELSNHDLHLVNNDEEISILKEENTNLKSQVEHLLTEVCDLHQKVNKLDKTLTNNSLQLSEINDSLDNP